MSEPVVSVRPTQYTVSVLPEDHIDTMLYDITVEYCNHGRWAIRRGKRCLGADGVWDWEPIPSAREGDWLATHRFDLDSALRLARVAAPNVRMNGRTAAEVLAELTGKDRG